MSRVLTPTERTYVILEVKSIENTKQYKYVCVTTNQPDTKSNPNPNPTTKQHAFNLI